MVSRSCSLSQVILGSAWLASTLPRVRVQDALLCCLHSMVTPRDESAEFGMCHSQLIAQQLSIESEVVQIVQRLFQLCFKSASGNFNTVEKTTVVNTQLLNLQS